MSQPLAPRDSAPQQRAGPRPLPLFLELVRRAATDDPQLARKALAGLVLYQAAPRQSDRRERSIAVVHNGASLRDCGGEGPPLVLIPSLINPPEILDQPDLSLAESLTGSRRVFLVDWGAASDRSGLSITGHVEQLLLPLLDRLGQPAVLVGYCLGGTMALAAASALPVRGVATVAAPWRFSAYPVEGREALTQLWAGALGSVERLGLLPMEVLQAAFWSLDPLGVVTKYARLVELRPKSKEARRFVALEDWANGGEPLPLPAARELFEQFFQEDVTGRGEWSVQGRLVRTDTASAIHFLANGDRIVPAQCSLPGEQRHCPSGHVGMVIGRSAPSHLHAPLREWVAALEPQR